MIGTDIFSRLPIFWKVLIIIGFITVFVTFILIIVILSFLYMGPKVDLDTNIDVYDDFLESLNENKEIEITEHDEIKYPSLPRIKDLDGNTLKDLLRIDIL